MNARPSMRLYTREDPRWRQVVEESESEYGFGYAMGELDARAGLAPLPSADVPLGYLEGYRDGFSDWAGVA